ncbi:MAG: Lcl domain-containing protein [Pirellulaceae bacterium]
MLKSIRFRRVLGVMVAMLGVATLAYASLADPISLPCSLDDANWVSSNSGCTDVATGKTWYSSLSFGWLHENQNWQYAIDHCASLDVGGVSDWRLPTRAEVTAAFQHQALAHFMYRKGGYTTWTSQWKGNKAWYGDFNSSGSSLILKTSSMDSACIRP